MIYYALLCYFVASSHATATGLWVAVRDRDYGEVQIVPLASNNDETFSDSNFTWIVKADYQSTYNTTGWDVLEITTNENVTDADQAYYAGWLEGFVTYDAIENHMANLFGNYCNDDRDYCANLTNYLQTTYNFTRNQVEANRQTDPYWHQAGLILEQLQGIADGYGLQRDGRPRTRPTKYRDLADVKHILLLNLFGELIDLETVLNKTHRIFGDLNPCSVLIKLVNGNADLVAGHVTWSNYNSMTRMLKRYNFNYHYLPDGRDLVAATSVSMSSYPGTLLSVDDFYTLSSGLVVTETTNEIVDRRLYANVHPEMQVMEFIRNLVANRLTRNGKEWTDVFVKYNSGTYNNQFMIIDYKEFDKWQMTDRSAPAKNILWIVEQIPSYTHAADVTGVLFGQGYWMSYNIPYFSDIFITSGYPELVAKYGSYYTHDGTPRARIFVRDQHKVVDMDTLMAMMRYNDFKNDPLSRCNCTPPFSATKAISARGDLNDPNGTYPFAELGFHNEGAIDAKTTNSTMRRSLEFVALSGPPCDSVPVFQWSTSLLKDTVAHVGQPDWWNFLPVRVQWRGL